jgi:hypothetical protein
MIQVRHVPHSVRRAIRILHRVEPKTQPHIYRMTPFWVMFSKNALNCCDLLDAAKASIFSQKIVKDEHVTELAIPQDFTARYVSRAQYRFTHAQPHSSDPRMPHRCASRWRASRRCSSRACR